jgi:cellulose synthase/poly-beta-1,6-N-acetylglucosamine synthase-like glycosyltransferase
MIFVFYILAAMLVFLSYKSFRGGIAYYKYFKQELSKPVGTYSPFATVIAPCKGMDEGLNENLSALLTQHYLEYEVVFVVDSESDPAIEVIKTVSRNVAKNAEKTKLVIAPRTTDSSQKVENLREAILHASDASKVFAFVDSDARPSQDWLRHLVAPLQNEQVGASTGYRWFISETLTFGSEMRACWNASIASALGPNRESNFCWGGSTAIRRETFDRINMRERWRGTLSDDFAVTRAMKESGLDIYFVPQALTASIGNCSLREAIEFTNRQMKITRVNAPDLWLKAYFGGTVFNAVMITSLAIMIFSARNDLHVLIAAVVFGLVSVLSIGKSWTRLKAVELVLAMRWPQVKRQWLSQNTLWLLSPMLFLINCLAATLSREMTWRGIRYRLKSPTETVIISGGKEKKRQKDCPE